MEKIMKTNLVVITMHGVLYIAIYFSLLLAFLNILSQRQHIRSGQSYSKKNRLADWSFVIGLIFISLYGLNSEKALPFQNSIVSILLCFWPFPWVIWFSNFKFWTLRTFDPLAKSKQ